MSIRFAFCAVAVSAGILLSGCSGGTGAVPASSREMARRGKAAATFRIVIPKVKHRKHGGRRANFVSPATASMSIKIVTNPGNVSVVNETVPLTTNSSACISTLASTFCTLTVTLAAGAYSASISTYDASENELSSGQNVAFSIVAGQTNLIAMTLNGIPASIRVASAAPAVHGAQGSGFTLYGSSAQKFNVEAVDADGNTIVGAGSPTFTVAKQSGTGFTITNPATTSPNTFSILPPGSNGQGATFSATAAYGDNTCATAGAVCTTNFTVQNDLQTLFIANASNEVAMYAAPFTGTPTYITNGISSPSGIALDGANNLYVANAGSSKVTVYAPPYTGSPEATLTMTGAPSAIAVNGAGTIFTIDSAHGDIDVAVPPYSALLAHFQVNLGVEPYGLALDHSGNLYTGDLNDGVYQFTPPFSNSSTSSLLLDGGAVTNLIIDRTGTLFSYDSNNFQVNVFAPPFTAMPTAQTEIGVFTGKALAVDGAGTLYIANHTGSVSIIPAPYSETPQTISGLSNPQAIAVDGTGKLLVVDSGFNGLYMYAPPFTGSPTINTQGGFGSPVSMLLTP